MKNSQGAFKKHHIFALPKSKKFQKYYKQCSNAFSKISTIENTRPT
jgi:hypothetical protein